MNEQDTPELLPCPHCGNDAAVSHRPSGFGQRPNGFRVACKSRFTTCPVNSRTHHAKTEQEAISAWNTRAEMPDTTAQADTVTPQQAAKVLLDEWDMHGEGFIGELSCYSQDEEDGIMSADIDGDWVRFSQIEAAIRAIAGKTT